MRMAKFGVFEKKLFCNNGLNQYVKGVTFWRFVLFWR